MSDSDSDSDSSSSEEVKKQPVPIQNTANDDSSDDSSSDSEDNTPKKATPVSAPKQTKDDSDSDSSSDDSDSDDDDKKTPAQPVKAPETADSSDSDSDSSSDDDEPAKTKEIKKVAETKKDDSDSDSDSDSSDDEKPTPAVIPAKTQEKDDDSDSSDSDSDSDDEKETKKTAAAAPAKKMEEDSDSDSDSSDSDDDNETKITATTSPAVAAKDDSDSDSDSDEKPAKTKKADKKKTKKADKKMDVDDEKKDDDMDVDDEPVFKPFKSDGPVTVFFNWDLKKSAESLKKSPSRKRKLENASENQVKKKPFNAGSDSTKSENSGSVEITKDYNADDFRSPHLKDVTCNVFVKGISTNCYEADIEKFFTEKVAKPVSIRHKWEESRSGLAWITFANPQQASKAVIDCNNEYIGDRYVNTDWAEARKQNNNRSSGPRNAHLKGTTERIWIGNLHREVQKETLSELFSEKGVPTDIFIIGRDETRPKVAYVSFETKDIASEVVEAFQGWAVMDYNIRLDWAEPRQDNGSRPQRKQELSEKQDGCMTCFVGRLNDSVDDDKLQELFKEAGTIESIRYMEKDGEFKGVAFVQFTETEATDKAVLKNGTEFLGKTIRVDFASQRKPRERY